MPRRISTGATANQICAGASINPGIAITPPAKMRTHQRAIPVDALEHGAEPSRLPARGAVAPESAATWVGPKTRI